MPKPGIQVNRIRRYKRSRIILDFENEEEAIEFFQKLRMMMAGDGHIVGLYRLNSTDKFRVHQSKMMIVRSTDKDHPESPRVA